MPRRPPLRLLALLGGAGLVGTTGAFAAAALEAPAVDLAASPAAAPFAVEDVSVNPARPVLLPTGPTRVTVDVTFSGDYGVADDGYAYTVLESPSGGTGPADLRLVRDDGERQVWRSTVELDRHDAVGVWHVGVDAFDARGARVQAAAAHAFDVRRATYLSASAGPEPVRRGSFVTVRGSLTRVHDGAATRRPVPGQRVRIFLQPAGSSTRSYRGTTRTTAAGTFARAFRARSAGTWYAHFDGGATVTSAWSRGDAVAVR